MSHCRFGLSDVCCCNMPVIPFLFRSSCLKDVFLWHTNAASSRMSPSWETRHYYKALNKGITNNDYNNHNKRNNNNQFLFYSNTEQYQWSWYCYCYHYYLSVLWTVFFRFLETSRDSEAQSCALLECTLLPVKTEAGMGNTKDVLLLETVNTYFQVNEVTESLTKYFSRSLLDMFCPWLMTGCCC